MQTRITFMLSMVLVTMMAEARVDNRCQSESICVYSKMPLLRQSDPRLARFIALRIRENPHRYKDPGLCAPVASTMAIAGIMSEMHLGTTPANGLVNLLSMPSSRVSPENKVWLIGKEVKTDFRRGGTKANDVFSAYKRFFHFKNQKSKQLAAHGISNWDNLRDRYGEYDNNRLVNSIKSKKHVLHTFLTAAELKKKKILWKKIRYYSPTVGHATLINGVDGNRLKMFDPWGSMYPVRTSIQKVKMNPLWARRVTLVHQVGRSAGIPRAPGHGPASMVEGTIRSGRLVLMNGYIKLDAN
jgi:hypothetical protein